MSTENLRDKEFEKSVLEFIQAFELVFDNDWEHTKSILENDKNGIYIENDRTFLNPLSPSDDEGNNWWNRGKLLSKYRNLKEELLRRGLYTQWD